MLWSVRAACTPLACAYGFYGTLLDLPKYFPGFADETTAGRYQLSRAAQSCAVVVVGAWSALQLICPVVSSVISSVWRLSRLRFRTVAAELIQWKSLRLSSTNRSFVFAQNGHNGIFYQPFFVLHVVYVDFTSGIKLFGYSACYLSLNQ